MDEKSYEDPTDYHRHETPDDAKRREVEGDLTGNVETGTGTSQDGTGAGGIAPTTTQTVADTPTLGNFLGVKDTRGVIGSTVQIPREGEPSPQSAGTVGITPESLKRDGDI